MRRLVHQFPVLCGFVGMGLLSACLMALPVIAVSLEQVNTTSAQTLTNKTLTAPVIATISNTGVLTLPTSTDTLVGRATTDTLTNKTLSSPTFSGTAAGTYTLGGTPTYGTGTMTGGFAGDFTLTSSHACATGYSRITPNFCYKLLPPAVAYTPANSCTGHVLDANLPTNKLVLVKVTWRTKANNGAGARLGSTTFHGGLSDCSLILATSIFSTYEQTAVAAATVIGEGADLIVVTTASGTLYATDLNNGGNGTSEIVSTTVWGYFE